MTLTIITMIKNNVIQITPKGQLRQKLNGEDRVMDVLAGWMAYCNQYSHQVIPISNSQSLPALVEGQLSLQCLLQGVTGPHELSEVWIYHTQRESSSVGDRR